MGDTSLHRRQLPLTIPSFQKTIHVDDGLKVLLAFVSLLLLFLNNGIYLLISFIVLLIIFKYFWRPYQPSIFLFCFIFQWFQIFAFILWMNSLGFEINKAFKMSSVAVLESLLGIVLMVWIVRFAIKKNFQFSYLKLYEEARKWDSKKILLLYLVSTLFLSSIGFVLGQTSGLAQILITLESLKWVFFIIYGFILWTTNGKRFLFWVICLFEFSTSFYSYFSDFKLVLFYLILILLSFTLRINFRQLLLIFLSFIILVFFFLTWNAIKGEYRNYLSSGERRQSVTVSRGDAYSKISDQLSQLTIAKYEKAVNFSLYRVQYIMHLAKVMERIPTYRPHENGNLWLSNIKYILTPRIFFPDKELFDPSVKTNKYTGMKYATGKMGTAFSLSYFAESYVDFGHIFMFLPLILIALLLSWIYNIFMSMKKLNLLVRFGLVTAVLFAFMSFESDGIFLIGRLLVSTIVMYLFGRFIFPVIQKWAYLEK